jgi:NAD(P)H dehydrogenase (quinone)
MVKSLIQTSDEGIFKFCGMETLGHKFFFAVPAITDVERKAMLEEVGKIAAKIG